MSEENIVQRCCICKKTETEPTEHSKYSDGFLSKKCYETFYSKEERDIVGKLDFKHETCEGLYPPI